MHALTHTNFEIYLYIDISIYISQSFCVYSCIRCCDCSATAIVLASRLHTTMPLLRNILGLTCIYIQHDASLSFFRRANLFPFLESTIVYLKLKIWLFMYWLHVAVLPGLLQVMKKSLDRKLIYTQHIITFSILTFKLHIKREVFCVVDIN